MNRRDFLQLGVAATAAGCATTTMNNRIKQPNILHITPHDLGKDLNCYGFEDIRSPRLNALADEGVLFTNYFCTSTACSPARGCTMTGRYSHSNGLLGLAHLGWALPKDELTFVDYFNEAGYETVHAGVQHERQYRTDNRYQVYLGESTKESHSGTSTFVENACPEVITYLQSKPSKPFYLNVGFFDVHKPWEGREPLKNYPYDPDKLTLPPHVIDIPYNREQMALFYASISHMDYWVGKVLDALRENGLEDDTIVIFTTDHGRPFPRAKSTLFDAGMNIALIMRWPNGFKGGVTFDHMVHSVELLPTILELCGLPINDRIQGRSFAAGLCSDDYEPNQYIFLERNSQFFLDLERAVRTNRFKYIRNFTDKSRWSTPKDHVEHPKYWFSVAETGIPRPYEQLFDLKNDPNEFNDVATAPEYAATLDELRGALDDWMVNTQDFMRGSYDICHWPLRDFRAEMTAYKLRKAEEKLAELGVTMDYLEEAD